MGRTGIDTPHCSILRRKSNEINILGAECSNGRSIDKASSLLEFDCNDIREVMLRVAEDPETPASVLAEMASDEDVEVRLSVAQNPNTPGLIVELLALDENPDVRYGLAENPNVPIPILQILAKDENPYVWCRAESTIARIRGRELDWAS
jgi:hypothetical protein